jgi:hypothetical protein
MTFNVFSVLNNTKLINDAIKNIPPEDTVQLWVNDDFKGESELCRPCVLKIHPHQKLTFPQMTNEMMQTGIIKLVYRTGLTALQTHNLMMHNALCNKEEWVGWLHDDITISLEDIQSLKDAIHDVPSCVYKINCVRGSNVESTSPDPEDLCVLYNTFNYWKAGGYDTNYYLYWSDIDFHLRQLALGNSQHGVDTPSVTHLLSSSSKNADPFNKKVNAMRHEFDCKYHAFKYPNQ